MDSICPLWTGSPIFHSNDIRLNHVDAESHFNPLLLILFFHKNAFFRRKIQKTENKHFVGSMVALRNSFPVFWVCRQEDKFLGKAFWRKVIWNMILHRISHVEYHLDEKLYCQFIIDISSPFKKISSKISLGRRWIIILEVTRKSSSSVTGAYLQKSFSTILNKKSAINLLNGSYMHHFIYIYIHTYIHIYIYIYIYICSMH